MGDNILSKNTIVKVRGGVSEVWSKTILSRSLILRPSPYMNCLCKKGKIKTHFYKSVCDVF